VVGARIFTSNYSTTLCSDNKDSEKEHFVLELSQQTGHTAK